MDEFEFLAKIIIRRSNDSSMNRGNIGGRERVRVGIGVEGVS
jgi:hypothetical protein